MSFFLALSIAGLYFLTNQLSWNRPALLPLFELEKQIPLMPWTMWIYLTLYLYMAAVFYQIESVFLFNRMAWALLFMQVFSACIFVFYPVIYPRELFPYDTSASFSSWAFQWIQYFDRPTNCLPSLHVSNTLLLNFAFLHEKRQRLGFHSVWGGLVILSTLTTKQHYIYDVVLGISSAIFFYCLFFKTRLIEVEEVFEYKENLVSNDQIDYDQAS